MNKHYIRKQDNSIYVINAKSPEQFLQDPENDVILTSADQAEIDTHLLDKDRQRKLEEVRAHRQPLLEEADVEINKLVDAAGDASSWRTYRTSLRDITDPYKADMSLLDAITDVASDITWPTKP